jgi:hypothetical protein
MLDEKETNREKLIDQLEKVINRYENQMNEWLSKLDGWTKERLLESNTANAFDCPYNAQHKNISSKNYAKHLRICKLKSQKHTGHDVIEYAKHVAGNTPTGIQIDEKEHQTVCNNAEKCVSLTTNHYLVNYSPEERLKLYDYSREKFKKFGFVHANPNEQTFLTDFDEQFERNSKEKPDLSATRDPKRRTKSYRTSGSRNYVEQLRELIQMQMEMIEQTQKNNQVDAKLGADEETNSTSRHSKHKKHKHKTSRKKRKHSSP